MSSEFAKYLIKFKGVRGIFAILSSALPLIIRLIQEIANPYLSPPFPIGIYILITLILLILVPVVIYQLSTHDVVSNKQKRFKILIALLLLVLVLFILFEGFSMSVVRKKTTPDDKILRLVVGLNRSNLAKTQYPNASDEEILDYMGWNAQGVRKGWIPLTVYLSYIILMFLYFAIFLLIFAIFSLAVLFDFVDSASPNI